MPVGEIYVKLIVGFPRDPKVRALVRLGGDAGLARDLYVQMVLYCKENLTDGFVPAEEVGVLAYPLPVDHANQLAKQLASVGLTKEVSKGEAEGWEVVAFLPRNGTRADVERLSRVRAEAGRTGGTVSRKRPAQRVVKAKGKQVANQPEEQTGSNADSVSDSVSPNGLTESEDKVNMPPLAADDESAPKNKRGTRIPDDFSVTADMVTWARKRCPNIDGRTETEKFTNHFSAKAGREALKLDWVKTWQNWMITAEQQAGRSSRGLPAAGSPADVSHLNEWKRNRS